MQLFLGKSYLVGRKEFVVMFNEKKSIEKIFFVFLFSLLYVSNAKAINNWVPGDDITVPGFSWSYIESTTTFYYVDDSDGNKLKECTTKAMYVETNHDAEHVCTTENNGINHFHLEDDWGEGDMAESSQADDYWNARFESPLIYFMGSTTNQYNCYAYVFQQSLGGWYECWINPDDAAYVFADDTYEVDQEDVEDCDILLYSSEEHATLVCEASGGEPTQIQWKFRASGIYGTGYPLDFDTPKCVGSDILNAPINEQGWTWSMDGAGSDGNVFRANE